MIRKTRLFTPGPTPLLPAAQFAMAAADIHHRTPEFRALFTKVLAQLKDFVGTTSALDLDGWGVDVLIGGSQKAVMIPPGLSYIAISPRAWDRMEATYNPRYYFDLRKERKNAAKGESAYTPPVALIAALGASLDYIAGQADGNLAEGRKKLVDSAEICAAMTRAAAKALGFKLFAPEGYEAAAA